MLNWYWPYFFQGGKIINTNVVRGTTGPGVEYFLSNYLPEHNDTEACLTDHVSPFFEGSLPRINVGHTRFQFWTNFRECIMVRISNNCHLFNNIIYRTIFVKYRRVIKHTGSEHYLLSWFNKDFFWANKTRTNCSRKVREIESGSLHTVQCTGD